MGGHASDVILRDQIRSSSTLSTPFRRERGRGVRRWVAIAGMLAFLPLPMVAAEAGTKTSQDESPTVDAAWRTYRSEKFGYEISYPPSMDLKAWAEGSGGDLMDASTGNTLVEFEVWPSDDCPRQPAGVSAKEIGVARARDVTQADGANSSSWCGDPVTVREAVSPNGLTIFELRLTCESERAEESDDGAPIGDPVRTSEGTKGPTYFVDVSPPWKSVILSADPAGVDPRMPPVKQKADVAVVRKILGTVKRLPTTKPDFVCIDELSPTGLTLGRPSQPKPTP